MEGVEAQKVTALANLGSSEFKALAAGGRAAILHELVAEGFPVPPGFLVPYEAELDRLQTELETEVAELGGYPVAVRSSDQLEQLAPSSVAGEFAGYVQVTTQTGLIEAVAACRATALNPQLVNFRYKDGSGQSYAPGWVMVQKLVKASVAGVAFSIHPDTGREEHGLVRCWLGPGHAPGSGEITPNQYVVSLEDGSIVERQPEDDDLQLDREIIHKLCRYALELQAHFGVPQEIEWALDRRGELWIMQTRPITQVHWRYDVEDFTNANFRDGGVAARVCTPFMYSLYRDAFQEALQQYFVAIRLLSKKSPQLSWISRFYGRPYWNASAVKQALRKVPGFDEERFDLDLGIQKDYGSSGPIRTPVTPRTLLAAVPVAIALGREFRRQLRIAENYGQPFLSQEENYLRLAESCGDMKDDEFFPLLIEVLRFHKRTESDYLRTVCNHVNYQAEFNKLVARIHAATGEPMAPVVLMSGLGDVSHMKIQRGFVKLVSTAKKHGIESAEWSTALAEFLNANSFHGDAQLDISAPRWRESPERIRHIVEDILRSGIEPKDAEGTAREQFRLYSEEVRRVSAVLHRSIWCRLRFERAFRKRLNTARTYASRREEMREYSMRADDVVRRYALEAGRRLHGQGWLREEEDVFMLCAEELEAIAEHRTEKARILALTEVRRLMHRGYRMVEPPGELGRGISHSRPADPLAEVSTDCRLKGTPCSAGSVRARARVVTTLAEGHDLQEDEILVTRFTDPSWTPVMGLVSGLITEVGGMLSHGAVIAREYGLPAVFNVPGATEIIKTGQVVEVDGTNGTVRILRAETRAMARDSSRPGCCQVSPRVSAAALGAGTSL